MSSEKLLKEQELKNQTKKKNYGKYFFVFLVLGVLYQNIQKTIAPHSLSSLQAFLVTIFSVFLSIVALYFLALWIMDLIRRRGGVEREENKKVKLIIGIIFAIIFLINSASVRTVLFNTSSNKLDAEQTVFLDEFLQKQQELVVLNNKQKTISLDLANVKDSQQMNKVLSDLLSVTQEIQVQIDKLKSLVSRNAGIFENEREKSAMITFSQSIDLRERHNKKLIELATLGLQIDWDNPSENQINKWTEIAQELSEIETELQAKQLDFQRAFQEFNK